MKKIKITETQKQMLESLANAKLMLTEGSIPPSKSPSLKVTKEFGKAKIKGFTAENAETTTNTDINWNELVTNVHEFLKQIYTNPSKEGLNPYWESIDVAWDELIQMLTAVGIIKSVKGGYRLTKVVESPAKAIKIVARLIEKMIKDKNEVTVEGNMSNDDIKQSLSNQLSQTPKKTGKTRAELLAIIAAKRAESQKITADREANIDKDNEATLVDEYGESGYYPAGTENDPSSPWNQVDNTKQGSRPKVSPFNIVWYHQDIAIFEKGGKYFAFNVESADNDEYAQYADREEIPMGRDEDGFMDVEYGDWEMKDDIVSAYVNDNLKHLSYGKGINDWENGVEMVEMDNAMAQDFMGLLKYIKGTDGEKLGKILSSLNLEEVSSTGSVGGSYVGNMSTGSPITKSNVASEMKDTIGEEKEEPLMEHLKRLLKDGAVSPQEWMSTESELKYIVTELKQEETLSQLIPYIVHMLQLAEKGIEDGFSVTRDKLVNLITKINPVMMETTTTTSVGGDSGTFAYDAPVGDGDKFWTAGNKMNKKSVKESSKAFTDTQYPNGGFVEIDKCAKIGHNDKTAINGGCSTGAVDNVVKTKSSKNSVISDSSVYESVAKATGRTLEEVKTILDKKINKSN